MSSSLFKRQIRDAVAIETRQGSKKQGHSFGSLVGFGVLVPLFVGGEEQTTHALSAQKRRKKGKYCTATLFLQNAFELMFLAFVFLVPIFSTLFCFCFSLVLLLCLTCQKRTPLL